MQGFIFLYSVCLEGNMRGLVGLVELLMSCPRGTSKMDSNSKKNLRSRHKRVQYIFILSRDMAVFHVLAVTL